MHRLVTVWGTRILISSGVDLMMKAASTSETLVNVYETTRSSISEDSHLNIHRRENLKYHRLILYL
jgi:hypothetical protein